MFYHYKYQTSFKIYFINYNRFCLLITVISVNIFNERITVLENSIRHKISLQLVHFHTLNKFLLYILDKSFYKKTFFHWSIFYYSINIDVGNIEHLWLKIEEFCYSQTKILATKYQH